MTRLFASKNRTRRMQEHGFTLTEVLIGLSLLGLVGYFAAGTLTSFFQSNQMVERRDVGSTFAAELGLHMRTQVCANILQGQTFPTTETPLPIPNYSGFGSPAPGTSIEAGYLVDPGLRVDSITMIAKPGVTPVEVLLGTETLERQFVQVEMQTSLLGANNNWMQRPPVFYDLPVLVNSSGQITECRIGTNLSEACNVIGGTYNIADDTCDPTDNCQLLGNYSTVECSPTTYGCDYSAAVTDASVIPAASSPPTPQEVAAQEAAALPLMGNPAMGGGASCPGGSSPIQVSGSTTSRKISCGKKCSVNVASTTRYFLCMKCPAP